MGRTAGDQDKAQRQKSLTQRMLIPSEKMVAGALQAAPAGELSDIAELRRSLARNTEQMPAAP